MQDLLSELEEKNRVLQERVEELSAQLEAMKQALSREVEDRNKSVEALRESEERFRAFMDNSPALAWMKDEDGRYVYLNIPCQNRFGIKSEEWLWKTDFDLWPEDVARQLRENDLAVLKSGKAMEVIERNYSPDRALSYWCSVKFPFQDSSGKRFVGGVGLDITEREQIAEELRRSEELFHEAFDHAPIGMTLLDLGGRFQRVNKAFCRITGYSEEELLKTDFKQLTHSEDLEHNLQQFERLLAGEIPVFFVEKRYLHKNGSLVWVRASATVRRDHEGRPFQLIGMAEDITERLKVAQQLRNTYEELEIMVEQRTLELREKTESLEEVNTALKVLLRQREEDKREFEQSVLTNVRNLVSPYIERLKDSQLGATQAAWVEILEAHIRHIVSSFSKTLATGAENLTPIEMRVAALVRDGKTSQQIAEALCISEKTVTFHRFNIRKKLGLRGEKANLRAHLSKLT